MLSIRFVYKLDVPWIFSKRVNGRHETRMRTTLFMQSSAIKRAEL